MESLETVLAGDTQFSENGVIHQEEPGGFKEAVLATVSGKFRYTFHNLTDAVAWILLVPQGRASEALTALINSIATFAPTSVANSEAIRSLTASDEKLAVSWQHVEPKGTVELHVGARQNVWTLLSRCEGAACANRYRIHLQKPVFAPVDIYIRDEDVKEELRNLCLDSKCTVCASTTTKQRDKRSSARTPYAASKSAPCLATEQSQSPRTYSLRKRMRTL